MECATSKTKLAVGMSHCQCRLHWFARAMLGGGEGTTIWL